MGSGGGTAMGSGGSTYWSEVSAKRSFSREEQTSGSSGYVCWTRLDSLMTQNHRHAVLFA
eukprot:2686304-Rhodomonas_salina.1